MDVFVKDYLWVFKAREVPGYPESLIEAAVSTGCGLLVKVHDGDPSDDGTYFTDHWKTLKPLADAAGVAMAAWGYCYGDKFGNLAKEASAVVDALTDLGAAGYVLNIEGEWEVPEGRIWAETLSARILGQLPDARQRLAFAPFWNTRWHGQYPAKELANLCSAVMPQCYFRDAKRTTYAAQAEMVDIMNEDFARLGIPVYPIGQLAGIRDVAAFLSLIGERPHSWWLLDHTSLASEDLRYLARFRAQNHGDEVTRLEEALRQATGLIAEAQTVFSRIQAFPTGTSPEKGVS